MPLKREMETPEEKQERLEKCWEIEHSETREQRETRLQKLREAAESFAETSEWQKRGFPQTHFSFWLSENDRIFATVKQ